MVFPLWVLLISIYIQSITTNFPLVTGIIGALLAGKQHNLWVAPSAIGQPRA
jgi:hypothetical protein